MDQAKTEKAKLPRPIWQESIQQINTLLVPAKEVVIIIRSTPTLDTITASLALSLALKKIGRRSHVVSPTEINIQQLLSDLTNKDIPQGLVDEVNQIANFLPQKQLILTIDYAEGTFSQGNLNRDDKGLVLTLLPKDNQPPITPLKIDSRIFESQPDVAILIGIENLSHLQQFYEENQKIFSHVPLINIDHHPNNTNYGRINLVDPKATSISEIVALMLYDLRFTIDENISQLLYTGIKYKTDNFAPSFFSANMLEAASICLRHQQKLKMPGFN